MVWSVDVCGGEVSRGVIVSDLVDGIWREGGEGEQPVSQCPFYFKDTDIYILLFLFTFTYTRLTDDSSRSWRVLPQMPSLSALLKPTPS